MKHLQSLLDLVKPWSSLGQTLVNQAKAAQPDHLGQTQSTWLLLSSLHTQATNDNGCGCYYEGISAVGSAIHGLMLSPVARTLPYTPSKSVPLNVFHCWPVAKWSNLKPMHSETLLQDCSASALVENDWRGSPRDIASVGWAS